MIPESEALSASWYFPFVQAYVTPFYGEHFHSGFCVGPLKI